MKDARMHPASMVLNVVAGLQEDLQQKQSPTENATTILEPIDNVANRVQNTQQQLATQLHQMQAMHIQYATVPNHAYQYYGGRGYHGGYNNYCGQVGWGTQRRINWSGGRRGQGNSYLTHYCWTHGYVLIR